MGYWAEMIAICFSIFWEVTRWPFNDNWNVAKFGCPSYQRSTCRLYLPIEDIEVCQSLVLHPQFSAGSTPQSQLQPKNPSIFQQEWKVGLILHDFAPSLPSEFTPKTPPGAPSRISMVDAIRTEFRFAPPFVAELLRHFDGDFLTLDVESGRGPRLPSILITCQINC